MAQRVIPGWMSLLFVAFLGYMLMQLSGPIGPGAPALLAQDTDCATTPQDYPALKALMNGERWARAINPAYIAPEKPCAALPTNDGALSSYAIVLKEGSGQGLACADKAAFTLQPVGRDGMLGKAMARSLTLGEQTGLDALLLGMREGEQRLVVFNPVKSLTALREMRPGSWQSWQITRDVAAPESDAAAPATRTD